MSLVWIFVIAAVIGFAAVFAFRKAQDRAPIVKKAIL